ncbi:hypothetical protein AAMO2058_000763200 [Amorphochlora amoebiformis]
MADREAPTSLPAATPVLSRPSSMENMKVVKMPCAYCHIPITVSRKDKRVDKGSMYKHMLNSCPVISRDYHRLLVHLKRIKNKSVLYASDLKSADPAAIKEANFTERYEEIMKLLESANDRIEDKVKLNQGVSLLTSLSVVQSAPELTRIPYNPSQQLGKAMNPGMHRLAMLQTATRPSTHWRSVSPPMRPNQKSTIAGLWYPDSASPPSPTRTVPNPSSLKIIEGGQSAGLKRPRDVQASVTPTKKIKSSVSHSKLAPKLRGWKVVYPEDPNRVIALDCFYDRGGSHVSIQMSVQGEARDRLLLAWFHEISKNPFVLPHIPPEVLRAETFLQVHRTLCGENADPRLKEWLSGQLKQGRSVPVTLGIGTIRFPCDLRFSSEGKVATVPLGEVKGFVSAVRTFFEQAKKKLEAQTLLDGFSHIECDFFVESRVFGTRTKQIFTVRSLGLNPRVDLKTRVSEANYGNASRETKTVEGRYLLHI